jgi:hypothetical protein
MLIYTTNNCPLCKTLEEHGFYNKLYQLLDDNGIPYKKINSEGWHDFGIENGPRDDFHRKMFSFVPLFVLVPYDDYYNYEGVDASSLFNKIKVFNGTLENERIKLAQTYRTYEDNSFQHFIDNNAEHIIDIKEPETL